MDRDALYYPNISIPSVDWLKRALLVFPHVARIVPENFMPADSKEVWEFENVEGVRGGPLLRRAYLGSGGVWDAQQKLVNRLSEDVRRDDSFIDRFGKESANRFVGAMDESSFYLHPGKMTGDLVRFLEQHNLAWPATGDRGTRGFVAVHPLLGELIMSTLAIACAKDEGFNIVSENGRVHRCLANHDDLGAYKEFTRPQAERPEKISMPDGDKLFEILVFQRCDASKLTPEVLGKLSAERQAIEELKAALEGIVRTIPKMQDETALKKRLESGVDDALRNWKNDRANMGSFARKIFSPDGIKPAAELLKSSLEKGWPALAGAGASLVLGSAVGTVIGLVVYAATSWTSVKEKERESPYRYLTRLEREGVVFAVSA
jgi:hypothetical protein